MDNTNSTTGYDPYGIWQGSISPLINTFQSNSGLISNVVSTPVTPDSIVDGAISSQIQQQAGTIYANKLSFSDNTGGYRLGFDTDNIAKFLIGNSSNSLFWNGSTLVINGSITATTGMIGGFTIEATDLTASSGGNTTVMSSGSVAFTAGPTGSPTFTVTQAGLLTATNAVITGTITATSGAIGGFTIGATTISSTGLTLTSGSSASLAFGATPPMSPTSGTGIYIDKTGLFGLSSNTQNFKISATDGSITAKAGVIGGFTITATELYGGIIKTAATVSAGHTGVIMDTAGLRGYDSVLGQTFNLPTDGSAPFFSSGVINTTIFNVDTAGVIRTSATVGDGTSSSAGILENDTGFYACEANQLLTDANVKILVNGDAFFRGEILEGDPTGARVNIVGNDIDMYDYSVGGTNPITGDTASLVFIRGTDPTRQFTIQKRASINSNNDDVLEIFATTPTTNNYNYIFIGRAGDQNNGTNWNVNAINSAINWKSSESASTGNGVYEVNVSKDNVLSQAFLAIGDSRTVIPGAANISSILQADGGISLLTSQGTGGYPNGSALGFANVATITNISLTSNVLTVTAVNNILGGFGVPVIFSGLTTSTFLNGQTATVLTASATQFTATFVHANVASHSDTGTATSAVTSGYYQVAGNSVALGLDMLPDTDNVYSIGSTSFRIKDLWVGGTIHGGGVGTVTSVSGTTNRITSTGGTTPVIDISASYVGQSSITTLGTITTGTLSTGAIIGGVTMTLGSDASFDTYYRNGSGILTRLANGTTGQVLTATTSAAPSWASANSSVVAKSYTTNTAVTVGDGLSIYAGQVQTGINPFTYSSNQFTANALTTDRYQLVEMDSTHFIVLYRESSGTHYFVRAGSISLGTITYGTAVQLTTTTDSVLGLVSLDSTHFVVNYGNSGATLRFVAGTLSGTTITMGSDTTKSATSNGNYYSLIAIDSTHFVCAFTAAGQQGAVAGSVSGTTITLGSVTSMGTSGHMDLSMQGALIAANTFVITGQTSGASNVQYAIIGTISGTTLTFGSDTTITSPGVANNGSGRFTQIGVLDSSHFWISQNYLNGVEFAVITGCSWATTTITSGTPLTVNNNDFASGWVTIDSTHALMLGSGAIAYYLTLSGTTWSVTTTGAASGISGNDYIWLQKLNANNFLAYLYNSSTNSQMQLITLTGSNISYGLGITVQSGITVSSPAVQTRMIYMNDGQTFIGGLLFNQTCYVLAVPTSYIGIAASSVSSNQSVSVQAHGFVPSFTGLSGNIPYYLQTNGSTSTTVSNWRLGYALNSTTILVSTVW